MEKKFNVVLSVAEKEFEDKETHEKIKYLDIIGEVADPVTPTYRHRVKFKATPESKEILRYLINTAK